MLCFRKQPSRSAQNNPDGILLLTGFVNAQDPRGAPPPMIAPAIRNRVAPSAPVNRAGGNFAHRALTLAYIATPVKLRIRPGSVSNQPV